MSNLGRRILIAMLLGVVLYAAFVIYVGYDEIRDTLAEYRWLTFVAALGLASVNYLFRFAKWEYYLARLDIRGVGKFDSLLVFLSGFVLTVTPGKVGEVFKSFVLSKTHGVSVERTAPIIVAERLTDVIGIVALVVVGSLGFSGGLVWAIAGAVMVLIAMVLIVSKRPWQALIAYMERSPTLERLVPKTRTAIDALQVVASPKALFLPTLLSIMGWGCEGVGLYVILDGFNVDVAFPLAMFFYASSTLAGALVPVPGGLGVAEAMLQQQMVQLGDVPTSIGTAAMLLIRFATLWYAVLVGFVALGWLRLRFPSLAPKHDATAG